MNVNPNLMIVSLLIDCIAQIVAAIELSFLKIMMSKLEIIMNAIGGIFMGLFIFSICFYWVF